MSGFQFIRTHRAGIFCGLIVASILGLVLLPGWGGLAALAQSGDTSSPPPVILTDGQDRYPLGLHLELLEDKEKRWTIEDVTSPDLAGRFRPSQEEVPVFGFIDSAYWVRLRVRNNTGATTDWRVEQLYANMHYVDLYQPHSNGSG